MDEDLELLKQALIVADMDQGVGAAQRLIDADADPKWVLEAGMAVAMFDLGEMWKRGEVFLPEVVASAEVFKACNAIVEPVLLAQKDPDAAANALVLMCTVKGDLHDLGKNMVGAMLRTSGFDVHDMGKDVSADRIIEAINELNPAILGMSALLTTTVPVPGDRDQEAGGRRPARPRQGDGGRRPRHARSGPRRSAPTATRTTRPRPSRSRRSSWGSTQ